MAKSMKVQVSNPMVSAIKKALKERDIKIEEISIKKFSEHEYSFEVGDIYDAHDHGDYDYKTDTYKCICVIYPWDYYAPACYLSTERLLRIFRSCPDKTLDCLMDEVCNAIAI